jgi:hypothetical protein
MAPRRQGGQRGNANAAKHHAHATRNDQIATRATNHKRRLLRQMGTRESALDPIARGYVALLAKLLAKLESVDAYLDENGLIRGDGEPQPVLRLYTSLANSARLTMQRLEAHLRESADDGEPLAAYLERAYGNHHE